MENQPLTFEMKIPPNVHLRMGIAFIYLFGLWSFALHILIVCCKFFFFLQLLLFHLTLLCLTYKFYYIGSGELNQPVKCLLSVMKTYIQIPRNPWKSQAPKSVWSPEENNIIPWNSISFIWGSWWNRLSSNGLGLSHFSSSITYSMQNLYLGLALLYAYSFFQKMLHAPDISYILEHLLPVEFHLHNFMQWPFMISWKENPVWH